MTSGRNARLAGAALISLAVHVALLNAMLTWLARPPVFQLPPEDTRAWTVRLVSPPPRAVPAKAAPGHRAARRATARPSLEPDVGEDSAGVGGETGELTTGPVGANGDGITPEMVRQALRGSLVGCANADRVGLNRAERTHCNEILGRGMAAIQRAMRAAEQERLSTPSTGDRAPPDFAAFREACRAYRQGQGPQPRLRDEAC